MARYVVNKQAQANGDHEVHKEGCQWWPSQRDELGDHASCYSAVTAAKQKYRTANGCATCSSACHTS